MLRARNRELLTGTLCALGLASAALVIAGPLNPPAGAVSSTYKTLSEVEPRIAINATNTPGDNDATPSLFKITQPGSYYLVGDVTGVSGKLGIEIAASHVTLDLNGFSMIGGAGTLSGIRCTMSSASNIAVRNGTVRNWAQYGIDFGSFIVSSCTISDVRSNANSVIGISVGNSASISRCKLIGNAAQGIYAGNSSIVSDCIADGNSTSSNAAGIVVGSQSSVLDCVASNNGAGVNGGSGILTSNNCTVSRCTVSDNGTGAAGGFGIQTGQVCLVDRCLVSENGSSTTTGKAGISITSGSTVQYCDVSLNSGDGILAVWQCQIIGNTCIVNGASGDGAGIHVTGRFSRVEGNHSNSADRGIDIDNTSNIVMRNTCSLNTTNWDIVAGNDVAPIVSATTNGAAITGNTYAGALGSTDPNANFTH